MALTVACSTMFLAWGCWKDAAIWLSRYAGWTNIHTTTSGEHYPNLIQLRLRVYDINLAVAVVCRPCVIPVSAAIELVLSLWWVVGDKVIMRWACQNEISPDTQIVFRDVIPLGIIEDSRDTSASRFIFLAHPISQAMLIGRQSRAVRVTALRWWRIEHAPRFPSRRSAMSQSCR